MAIIVPALLESVPATLSAGIHAVIKIPNVQRIQIDFVHDHNVPGSTVPISEIEQLNPNFHWEAHLMVENPRSYFEDARLVGFKTIILQYESCAPEELAILAKEIRRMNLIPALGVYPETSVEDAIAASGSFDQVTLLGVTPGKQGQAMNENALERLGSFSELLDADKIIEFDGGVTLENVASVAEAGAAFIVVGSAVFGHGLEQAAENFTQLEQAAK